MFATTKAKQKHFLDDLITYIFFQTWSTCQKKQIKVIS